MDVVKTGLQPHFGDGVMPPQRMGPALGNLSTEHISGFPLRELVHGERMVLVKAKVRPKLQMVVLRIGRQFGVASGIVSVPFTRQNVAVGVAPIAGVHGAKTAELTRLDHRQGDLIG